MFFIILANSVIVSPVAEAKDLGVVVDPLPVPCPLFFFFQSINRYCWLYLQNSFLIPCFPATILARISTIISFLDYLLQWSSPIFLVFILAPLQSCLCSVQSDRSIWSEIKLFHFPSIISQGEDASLCLFKVPRLLLLSPNSLQSILPSYSFYSSCTGLFSSSWNTFRLIPSHQSLCYFFYFDHSCFSLYRLLTLHVSAHQVSPGQKGMIINGIVFLILAFICYY